MIYKFFGVPGGLTALRAAAHRIAQAAIYQQLNLQAGAMGYMDTYRVLGWASGILVGFAFLLTKNRAGAGRAGGRGCAPEHVLRDVPTARGAGVRTPFYCFAWAFRWSATRCSSRECRGWFLVIVDADAQAVCVRH